MDARVRFHKSTLCQTGTVGKILMWMQDNEKFCRDTTLTAMARMISANFNTQTGTIKNMLLKMWHNSLIEKSAGGRHRGRVYINYYHKDLPGYILDRAPQDIQDRVRAMRANLNRDQYISKEGCLVTVGKKTLHEPHSVITDRANSGEEEKQEDATDEPKDVKSDAVQPIAQEIEDNTPEEKEDAGPSAQEMLLPVIVKREQSGRNISLTININLNA